MAKEKKLIRISGMHRVSCAQTIEKALKKEEGIINANVNFATEKAVVEYDSAKVSLERIGDITLVRGELSGLVSAIRLSRATFRKIKQNLFRAFIYNTVATPIAIFGPLHPVIAELCMASSSISVVTNANLLRRAKIRPSYS